MTMLKSIVVIAGIAAVLCCVQSAWSETILAQDVGVVALTVEKYININIPLPTNPQTGLPVLDSKGLRRYGLVVTSTDIGTKTNNSYVARLMIEANSNCKSWVRVPKTLSLTDSGRPYSAVAYVTLEPFAPGAAMLQDDNFWYQPFQPISPGQAVINATLTVTPPDGLLVKRWGAADLAGYYWGTFYVDIQANDNLLADPGGWPTHVEPTHPY